MTRTLASLIAVALVCCGSGNIRAASLSFGSIFDGPFAADDDVVLKSFSLSTTLTLTFESLSYAGGTAEDGTVVPDGGFDLHLWLFDAAGNWIADDDDSSPNIDTVTATARDSLFSQTLGPGSYQVAVVQYDNELNIQVNGLASGWSRDGQPTFTSEFDMNGVAAPNAPFVDIDENGRNGQWFFQITGFPDPDPTAIPEPSAALLGLLGLVSLAAMAFRSRRCR